MPFHDRADAGRQLAQRLGVYANRRDVIVLGLPRGGVLVAREVASALAAPLDVFMVRKLGVPEHPELAMGAIAFGGVRVLSEGLISELDIPRTLVEQIAVREHLELDRRHQLYRRGRAFPALGGRTVIIVDDGLATGATAEAAVVAIRDQRAAKVVVAAPVGAPATCERLKAVADDVVCAVIPNNFYAVGRWYERFDQTTDEEVIAVLEGEWNRDAESVALQEAGMATREIPREQWRQELDMLSREREGWIVRVDVTESGNTRTEAEDVPFYGVSVDNPRADAIAVIVGHEPGDHMAHEVARPVKVSIESEGGSERALRIAGEDGSMTTVEFERPPRGAAE